MADRVAVIVTGSSAVLRLPDYMTHLQAALPSKSIRWVLTQSAQRLVQPTALRFLTEDLVLSTDDWNPVQLAEECSAVIVAPCTYNFLVGASLGLAATPSLTLFAAADGRMAFPHMPPRLWKRPAATRAVTALRADGVLVHEPEPCRVRSLATGGWAEGLSMPEPVRFASSVTAHLQEAA